jgi:hypothetical protein
LEESYLEHKVKAVGMDALGTAYYECSCGQGGTFSLIAIGEMAIGKKPSRIVCDGKTLKIEPYRISK